jgi:hypothetical protein
MFGHNTPFNLDINMTGPDRLFVHAHNLANVRLVGKHTALRWKPCRNSQWPLTDCKYMEEHTRKCTREGTQEGLCVDCFGRTDDELLYSLAFAPYIRDAHTLARTIQSEKMRKMATEWAVIRSVRAQWDTIGRKWQVAQENPPFEIVSPFEINDLLTINPDDIFDSIKHPGVCIARILDIECDSKYLLDNLVSDESQYCWSNKLRHVTLPPGPIDNKSFSNCEELVSVSMKNTTSIGDEAFIGCSNLTYISESKVTSLGTCSFGFCENIIKIIMPHVTTIGNECFTWAESITSLNFPVLTTVGDASFNGLKNLTSISMPLLRNVGCQCFRQCLKIAVIWLESVTHIDEYAFDECTNLVEVWIPSLIMIAGTAFAKCKKIARVFVSDEVAAETLRQMIPDIDQRIVIGNPQQYAQ